MYSISSISNSSTMYVVKRNGSKQEVSFDKITARIKKLCYGFESSNISPIKIAQKVIAGIYDGVTTTELDCLAAETTAYSSTIHPDYSLLASRIAVSNLHKNTEKTFSNNIQNFYNYVHPQTRQSYPLISKEIYDIVFDPNNKDRLDSVIIQDRDFYFDYFGFKTLEKSYLIKMDGVVQERPQHMFLRVALGIHKTNIDKAIETYNLMSQKYFTHATPTLYNAGTNRPQLSSCFLLTLEEDSIDGIYNTLKKCALISKHAGGIGLSIHNVRSKGSYISGTNGISNGIVPMLKVFNDTARYVDQCFTGDTPIYTSTGIIQIKDIKQNMRVLTHDGSFQSVEKVRSYQNNSDMVEIESNNFRIPTCMTLQHPILVLQHSNKLKAEYVEAKDIIEGDYISFPIPHLDVVYSIYSYDDLYYYGIIVGNGIIENDKLFIETDKCSDLLNYINSDKITYKKIKNQSNKTVYCITNSKLLNMNQRILSITNDSLIGFINGLLFNSKTENRTTTIFINQNIDYVGFIQYCLLRLELYSTIQENTIQIPHTKEFKILFPKQVQLLNVDVPYLIKDNTMYVQINNISRVKYDDLVYDLDIDTNHNYVTDCGIVHNGGGKRKGSFAIYLEPWHMDIYDFLNLKKPVGNDLMRAHDLFYAMWISDLFMKRVENNETWTLFCPNDTPELYDSYGDKFVELYTQYEASDLNKKTIQARDLWNQILESQIETGTPYILYKDACNEKSNQKNLGTIHSSNLCTEIVEYSSKDEIAVCNLASINLQMYINAQNTYDFKLLYNITKVITYNLNEIIDVNFYPVIEAENSNKRHRPIGIGVQGLADTFLRLRLPFESKEAKQLNIDIFETIYYAAMETSIELAKEHGTYSSYEGSPLSQGLLQCDLWGVKPSNRWDWNTLRENLKKYGARNSLLLAPMPTASTAQILGNNESIEPYTTNIYTRRVLAGEFTIVNKFLQEDLLKLGLWTDEIKNKIIMCEGSIQSVDEISDELKELYKTVWEIKQKNIIDMSADRAPFICQSQSLNIHIEEPTISKLTSCHFYSWKKGLKTGMYYLRSRPKTNAIQFTVDKSLGKEKKVKFETCEPGCDSCGA